MLLWEPPHPDEYPMRERESMQTITYDPSGGHRCTECLDALLPDEKNPGDYVGRHRADMEGRGASAIAVKPLASHSWLDVLNATEDAPKYIAAEGLFLPAVVFRVETHDHDAGPRHAELAPAWR